MSGVSRDAISSPAAPRAAGPYSQAVASGDHVFLSGQTPIDPATGALVDADVAGQAQRCFDNLGAVLAAAGLTFDDVVKVNVYLTSMDDFAEMNRVYARQFTRAVPGSDDRRGGRAAARGADRDRARRTAAVDLSICVGVQLKPHPDATRTARARRRRSSSGCGGRRPCGGPRRGRRRCARRARASPSARAASRR